MVFLSKSDNQLTSFPHNLAQGPMPTEQVLQEALEEIQGRNFETMDEINEFLNKKLMNPSQ
ncbi:hypothetical protein [Neobacillus sp. CF12]|uniref:hypothetical protein n=1 Tax=Neobacillus sp. CF12 TaxID=3055864 RepID=UPI0025A0A513|nr:hypothetical protein [Neobacillus sp. CF12]MDM5330281.1 hypothetical protein [Neobacillus sp. CF12]